MVNTLSPETDLKNVTAEVSLEIPGGVSIEPTVQVLLEPTVDFPTKTVVDPMVMAPAQVTVEVHAAPIVENSVEYPLEVPAEATVEVPFETTAEIPREVTAGSTAVDTLTSSLGATAVETAATSIINEINVEAGVWPSEHLQEQIVEFSVHLMGEVYSDDLKDPSSPQYQNLAQQFTEKIEDAFEGFPWFKGVFVLEFREHMDTKGPSTVVVHYAVTLEVDAGGIGNNTLDHINLPSNAVEVSYPGSEEQPSVVFTVTDLRSYITEALHKENLVGNSTLVLDPDSLQLENVLSETAIMIKVA
ncbi:hypothetical protein Z043_108960 [Scleropages formosus]|uniref:SEA domain-containing protein n=1 Tax=Scleropages formosus TaxID=113540 RepID=A0A0P7UD92_SCLFO|nr:hypothetical protein Z043_108960 [Scleropages formosus]